MPVAFMRPYGVGGYATVARPRFILGSDLDADLVDTAVGVAEHHATVRLRRGEYILVAEDGCSVWVRGARAPLISLRDGDVVSLAPKATPWVFRSRVEGSFWPPEYSVGEAWLQHPAYPQPSSGPERFGGGKPLSDTSSPHSRLVLGPYGPLVVKYLSPIEEPKDATRFLRFLAGLGGALHPALAPVVDGGVAPYEDGDWRWIATRYVEGTCARDLFAGGASGPHRVVRILRSLAEAVAHLHHRGIVHRNLALGNVIVLPTDEAVVIDYGSAWSMENPALTTQEKIAASGFAAPEALTAGEAALDPAVDVFSLAAVGRALLSGAAALDAQTPTAALARLRETSVSGIGAVLPLIREGLDPDPTTRPDAVAFVEALREVERELGAPRAV